MTLASFDVSVSGGRESVIERVTEVLKGEGFGVLTRIDMDQAFAEKLGTEFRPYTILGVCNPPLAHAAVSEAPEIGLMLPCNVTVEADPEDPEGRCLVRIADPAAMMRAMHLERNPIIAEVGEEAYELLRNVARALGGA